MRAKNKGHWARSQNKKKIRKIKINHGIIFKILFVVFLGVVIYSFIFSSFLEVSEIEINGLETLSQKNVEESAKNITNGKYIGFIPKNNILFIMRGNFSKKLTGEFKKIEEIKIKKKFPNKLIIEIEERSLVLTLCSQGNCFFVDKKGYAYAEVDFDSEEVRQNNLVKLIDESEKPISEGDLVLRPSFVEFIFSIANEIRDKANVGITNEYRSKSLIAEEVIVQTDKGWDIYLSSNFPIDKSARILKTILNKQISLKDANELEYIDLRSENKVFYRMKGAGAIEEQSGGEDEIKDADQSDKENND